MRIFVPVVNIGTKTGSLYSVEIDDCQDWIPPSYDSEAIKQKIKSMLNTCFRASSRMSISINRNGDRKGDRLTITGGTQSVFLGLYLAMIQHIRNLRCGANSIDGSKRPVPVGSITVTGDLSFGNSELPSLEAVPSIPDKFDVFQTEIQKIANKDEMHLFIYITENEYELPVREGLHGNNITVKAFISGDSGHGIVDIKQYLSHLKDSRVGSREYDQFKSYGDLFCFYADNPDKNREYYLNLANDYYAKAFEVSKKIRIRSHIDMGDIFSKYATYASTRENIQQALEHYVEAIKLIGTKETYPEAYASDYFLYYADAIKGYATTLTDYAITTASWEKVEQLLKELENDNLIIQGIADIKRSMSWFSNRMDEFYKKSIDSYEELLKGYDSETSIDIVRDIKIKLADVLSKRSDVRPEIKTELFYKAMAILQDEVLFPKSFKTEKSTLYAEMEIVLGTIYERLSYYTDRAENAQKSIEAFTKARHIYTKDTYYIKYGRACLSISTAYSTAYAATGKVKYAKLRKKACEEALNIFKKESFLIDYAATMTSYANACTVLLYKEKKDMDFNKIVDAYNEAFKIFNAREYPFWQGRLLYNIGDLYRQHALSNLVSGTQDKIQHFRTALDNFDKALVFRTSSNYRMYYCTTQLQKGRTFIDLSKLEQPELNLKNAIKVFDETIPECPDIELLTKGRLHNNKGIALEELFLLTNNASYLNDGISEVKKGLCYAIEDDKERIRMEEDLNRMNLQAI